jgi:glutamate dehydrogenase
MYNLSRNSKIFARVARECRFNMPQQYMLKLNRAASSSIGGSSTIADSHLVEGKSFSTNAKPDQLLNTISDTQMETNVRTIPWFQSNMPESYFRQIPEEMRTQHLIAVSAIRQLGNSEGNEHLSLQIKTETPGKTEITVMNTDSRPGNLFNQMKLLPQPPQNTELTRVKVFQSNDGALSLNIFTFNHQEHEKAIMGMATGEDASRIYDGLDKHGMNVEADLNEYITLCAPDYIRNSELRDFLVQKELYSRVKGSDQTEIKYEAADGLRNAKLTLASSNVRPEVLLRLTLKMLHLYGIGVLRAHMDKIKDPLNDTDESEGYVTMLRLFVTPETAHKVDEVGVDSLLNNLKRIKWLDDETVDLGLHDCPQLGLDKAEVVTALCSMLQGPLFKINANIFASLKSTLQVIKSKTIYVELVDSIAELFLDKFKPSKDPATGKIVSSVSEAELEARISDINRRISTLNAEGPKALLYKLVECVQLTLRTNFYNRDRYALSLRIDPSLLVSSSDRSLPYGVLFSHGRWFNGFHNRFRDIARGGLRIVIPQNVDQYHMEACKIYEEVYALSNAQQLKNKDIPEGGAKAVVLVNTSALPPAIRSSNIRKSIRAFTDSILDLIVKDSTSKLVDYYKKDELIYLGPDENVVPSDIEWICKRAAQRGYPIPAAFMSSKADAGFNHKEFGVTSEGVVVYLDVALRATLGIDPDKEPFTLKITGGPDGDVAGNLMKIVINKYGKNVKIVGIADGFGVAEDPNGLDSDELLRLVNESLPITSFDRSRLSAQGEMLEANDDEGITRRNTMHFRVKSDAFVPAGGRPNTINAENVRNFIDDNGVPSSPLIVEGANIFITNEAREILYKEAQVPIVKDSTANKCGVIASSCEIAASMLVSKEEFMEMKPVLVKDVIDILHSAARKEAELLFREYGNYPGNLPHFSERISMAISRVTDAVDEYLQSHSATNPELLEELLPVIKDKLPHALREPKFADRIKTHFPLEYQYASIASALATELVYNEGINFVESQPNEKLAERAINYHREFSQITKMLPEVEGADMAPEARNKVLDLLKRGGARTAMGVF